METDYIQRVTWSLHWKTAVTRKGRAGAPMLEWSVSKSLHAKSLAGEFEVVFGKILLSHPTSLLTVPSSVARIIKSFSCKGRRY